jgi:hypothetical protein
MDQLAFLVKNPHDLHNFQIDLTPLLNASNLCILESGSILHVLTNEIHN